MAFDEISFSKTADEGLEIDLRSNESVLTGAYANPAAGDGLIRDINNDKVAAWVNIPDADGKVDLGPRPSALGITVHS